MTRGDFVQKHDEEMEKRGSEMWPRTEELHAESLLEGSNTPSDIDQEDSETGHNK